MFRWRTCATLTAGLSIFVVAALSAQPAPSDPPPGPGLDLIQRSCTSCHDIYMITTKRKTPREWATIVGVMADRGAEVTPEEMQIIEDYLSQNFSAAANAH
jgi:hypothetical protein